MDKYGIVVYVDVDERIVNLFVEARSVTPRALGINHVLAGVYILVTWHAAEPSQGPPTAPEMFKTHLTQMCYQRTCHEHY